MPFFGGGGGDYHIVVTNVKGGTDAAPALIGDNNMALGNGALQNAENVDAFIAIGNNAANALVDAQGNASVVIGYRVVEEATGLNNVVAISPRSENMGDASGPTSIADSVLIGLGAGTNAPIF